MGEDAEQAPDQQMTGDTVPVGRGAHATRRVVHTGRRVLGSRPRLAAVSLTAVFVLAGLLFTTSAQTARGTSLRTDRTDVAALVRAEESRRVDRERRVQTLSADVIARTAAEAAVNGTVRGLQAKIARLAPSAGLQPVSGPTYEVTLDDAPAGNALPQNLRPDELVVHQQDVQGVVNALWAGGAEAMMLMDQRVISTSAVRCVGNTLILQGRVYSPPYRIQAIGDRASLEAGLASSREVAIYREYTRYGLGYTARELGTTTMPGYPSSTELRYARPPRPAMAR